MALGHGVQFVLPPVPTFDGRHVGEFGCRFKLGLDDIFTREYPDDTVTNGVVGDISL